MKKLLSVMTLVTMMLLAPAALAKSPAKARAKIDRMAKNTLAELFEKSEKAKALYDKAVAYAVFDNLKLSLFISGGGGAGVAVDKGSGARIYMKMGTAGLNIGLGGQKYQVIFLFQDASTFKDFVEKGWQAGAEANAVAGKSGANAGASFIKGVAVYQITDAGLMLQVDISGTKYWKAKKLNRR